MAVVLMKVLFNFDYLTSMDNRYDLVIVGGGPIGLACGLEAKKKGLNFIILEKGTLTNSLYNYPVNMTFFSTSEKLEIGGIPFVSNNIKPTRPEALEYYRRVAVSNKLPIKLQEKVLYLEPQGEEYAVHSTLATYQAKYIVIATGFYDIPVLMHIPGEELPKVTHYYKDPHFYAMQRVVVVGANNSAVDAALETFRKGAEVTLVSRGHGIGKRVKYWVRPDIENRIKEGSIKAHFDSQLTEIRDKEVDIRTPEGMITIPNDYVIATTGYMPDFEFLSRSGIAMSCDDLRQPAYNPENMESNLPNVFLAGVVCGGMNTHVWFIENSREHAVRIIDKIVSTEGVVRV
jgi:thioredoxin reductase (NADPH)